MPVKVKPEKEEQAPAYMSMYSSLWCIMLAFFISLLSLGHDRAENFREGVGAIRNAFGVDGGFGLLQFIRGHRREAEDQNVNSRRQDLDEEPEERAALIGFFKNMLWKEGLSSVAILDVKVGQSGASAILQTPVEFYDNTASLTPDSRKFLNKIGTIFYGRPDLNVHVESVYVSTNTTIQHTLLALQRSSSVVRYLIDECRIGEDRLSSLGFGSARYLPFLPDTNNVQSVLLSVNKQRSESQ